MYINLNVLLLSPIVIYVQNTLHLIHIMPTLLFLLQANFLRFQMSLYRARVLLKLCCLFHFEFYRQVMHAKICILVCSLYTCRYIFILGYTLFIIFGERCLTIFNCLYTVQSRDKIWSLGIYIYYAFRYYRWFSMVHESYSPPGLLLYINYFVILLFCYSMLVI
jgi:hypothetical protein